MHSFVWQSGRKTASSRVAPQDEFISLSQQQVYKAAGTGCFLREAMSHARTNQKQALELARKRQFLDLDVYGERRDSEQPKAANLSAWRIATVKKHARTNQKQALELARKRQYQQIPVPEKTSLSAYALQRKEKNYGRQ
jgi:hypothetical protein